MKRSLDEILKSTISQTNESPGNDGLTSEFLAMFKHIITPTYLGTLCFRHIQPYSQR